MIILFPILWLYGFFLLHPELRPDWMVRKAKAPWTVQVGEIVIIIID